MMGKKYTISLTMLTPRKLSKPLPLDRNMKIFYNFLHRQSVNQSVQVSNNQSKNAATPLLYVYTYFYSSQNTELMTLCTSFCILSEMLIPENKTARNRKTYAISCIGPPHKILFE